MIDAVVSLNGQEFEVVASGDRYDGEMLDFNNAVARALTAQRLAFPLDPIDIASLVVTVRRAFTERASHDGAGVDVDRAPVVLPDVDTLDEGEDAQDFEELTPEEQEELTAPDEPEEDKE